MQNQPNAYVQLQNATNVLAWMLRLSARSLQLKKRLEINAAIHESHALGSAEVALLARTTEPGNLQQKLASLSKGLLVPSVKNLQQQCADIVKRVHDQADLGWPVPQEDFKALQDLTDKIGAFIRKVRRSRRSDEDLRILITISEEIKRARKIPHGINERMRSIRLYVTRNMPVSSQARRNRLLAINNRLREQSRIYPKTYMQFAHDILGPTREDAIRMRRLVAELYAIPLSQPCLDWSKVLELTTGARRAFREVNTSLEQLEHWIAQTDLWHQQAIAKAKVLTHRGPNPKKRQGNSHDEFVSLRDTVRTFAARLHIILVSEKPRPAPTDELKQATQLGALGLRIATILREGAINGFDFETAKQAAIVPGFEKIFK